MSKTLESFQKLLDIMDRLREECPWDKKQTIQSLRKLTIEETFELADAISNNDLQELKGELGDLLLHIVFYSKLGNEQGEFDMNDVIEAINKKLIFRHPHIFSDTKVESALDVEANWEALKLKEKGRKQKRVLEGVPSALPAMIKANRIQEKVRGVGFDWEERDQVWEKVNEEMDEVKSEIERKDQDKIEAEFGDLFFALINAARLYDVDPEQALERTNRKFIKRFNYLEDKTIKRGKSLKEMSLAEMDKIWDEAKREE